MPRLLEKSSLVVLLGLALALSSSAVAAPSGRSIGFRGKIADGRGGTLTGPVDATFRLYDAPKDGHLIAGPFGPVRLLPNAGEYSSSIGPLRFEDVTRTRWLEITTSGRTLPRIEMMPVYYDWIDEHGKLRGDRTLTPRTAPELNSRLQVTTSPNVTTILDNGPIENRIDLVYIGDGYLESELWRFAQNTQTTLDALLSQEPFASYRTFFNAHRVDVISNESGVDNDPDLGITRDTALNMGFWCGGTQRLLCVDYQKANQYASYAPAMDMVFALANTTTYGGAGSSRLATIAGGNGAAAEIGVHECGHSLGYLADEYEYDGPLTYTGTELQEPNVSILRAPEMTVSGTKWSRWLGDPGINFGGLVDTYEGGHYSFFGVFRPTMDSKMRSLGQPFNLPSVEALILQFYQYVRPIENATPDGTVIDESSTAFVDPVDPPGHPLEITWSIDGVAVPGANGPTFQLCHGSVPPGDHLLAVTVRDTTPWVRDEAQRQRWMSESRTWTLRATGTGGGDCAPIVTAPAVRNVDEGATLSFSVSAVDPNGDPMDSLVATGDAFAAGATFQSDPTHTSGVFQWTPGFDQQGTHVVTFTAVNAVHGTASTSIHVRNVNLPPTITAPAQVNGAENASLSFDVTAQDPDGEVLVLGTSELPSGAAFLDHENNTGTLQWLPRFDQAGDYTVLFTASDGSGAAATGSTAIHIGNVDRPPQISAPASVVVQENHLLNFPVSVADPDAESAMPSLAVGTLPEGASFTAGVFRWTPSFSQAGSYVVSFTASNALTTTSSTSISVGDVDRPPDVTAPTDVTASEGAPVTIQATTADPDGDAVLAIEVSGLPSGASFQPDIPHGAATLSWTPGYDQAGAYHVTLSASSASRASAVSGAMVTGSAEIAITVGNTDRPPVILVAASAEGAEGQLLTVPVQATDPDGDAIAGLEADLSSLPTGDAVFEAQPGNTAAQLRWTPTFLDGGPAPYLLPIHASNALSGNVVLSIRIADVNRPPVAIPGGPYHGTVGVPVAFDGGGSSDPDGQALRYDWTFGDLATGTGAAPTHTYAGSGMFAVTLDVTDDGSPPLHAEAASTASIEAFLPARLFVAPAQSRVLRLMSGNDWCVQVEPVTGDFRLEDLDLGSATLGYASGSIASSAAKTPTMADRDRNGTPEVAVCFHKTSLRDLFASLPRGRSTVEVTLEANLNGGGRIRGTLTINVETGSSQRIQALASPNPARPGAMLTFTTAQAGVAEVNLFDATGRKVRTLLQSTLLPAGYHDLPIDGRDDAGRRLASGTYFYRIRALGAETTGRIQILH